MYRTPYSDTLEETRAFESESSPHRASATLFSRERAGMWLLLSAFDICDDTAAGPPTAFGIGFCILGSP